MLTTADRGTGADATASGNSPGGYGILVATDRNITFDTPGGEWNGRLFSDSGKTLKLFSDVKINQPASTPVPLPATAMAGLALIGGVGLKRLRRRQPAA